MEDRQKIKTLLASAGMLMEDASAKLIIGDIEPQAAAKLLRDTSHDILIIAKVVEVIDRVSRMRGG